MPDIPADGNIRVTFMTSCASITAPTTTELNNGLLLAGVASATGMIGWDPATASVSNRKLNSTFNSVDVGSISIEESTIEFFKQSGTDTTYTTMTKGTPGFVAIRRSLATTVAWGSAQLLQGVYPVKCGQRIWLPVEENSMERWRMPFKITSEPAFDAVVA